MTFVAAAGGGAVRFLRWHPYGLGIDSNAVSNCYNQVSPVERAALGARRAGRRRTPWRACGRSRVDARRNSDNLKRPLRRSR